MARSAFQQVAISPRLPGQLDVGDSGPAVSGLLSAPSADAVDGSGNVFIVDSGQNRIREVTPDGTITTVAGTGYAGPGIDASPRSVGYLSTPEGVAVGPDGGSTSAAIKPARSPRWNNYYSGRTGGCCFAGDGGPATAALFLIPNSVVVELAGDVCSSTLVRGERSPLSPVVREVTPDGNISTVVGMALFPPVLRRWRSSRQAGSARDTRLRSIPPGISLSPTRITTVLQGGQQRHDNDHSRRRSNVASGDGGPATAAGVPSPFGMVADSLGNIYISSYQGSIRKVGPDGTISTYAGGHYGFSGDGGPATSAALAGPHGLALDGAGNLYIADYSNNRVRVVSPQ